MEFNEGFIFVSKYQQLLETPLFKDIESYSDLFSESNKDVLSQYGRKWVCDPLHQWSRQWEYPYVFQRIKEHLQTSDTTKVLDAGSGMTFFPFLLSEKIPNAKITCCDYDINLKKFFDKINNKNVQNVSFASTDLRKTPFDDNSFDVIYCISVLEHTGNYNKILDEFFRVLKKGGMLVLTMDVSIDGKSDINFADFKKLMADISKRFSSVDNEQLDACLNYQNMSSDLISTSYLRKVNPDLLPWKYPVLHSIYNSIKNARFPDFKMHDLACACFSFLK